MASEGLTQTQMDAMDTTESSSVRHYECPICSDTTASTLSRPVGLLSRMVVNYAIGNSVADHCPDLTLVEMGATRDYCSVLMLKVLEVSRRMTLERVSSLLVFVSLC
ncbi:unnamed protein product [Gongylonema pulchrum]|uniref:RING-type E3 ubiquitin transferase n=1 Tax=Gongylonema pulchrum TaxID=637853 RepID=A0A183EJT9_9BILA|nr:unnamed protein product [Gongylonema pulchrum]